MVTENVPCGTTGATCSKAIRIFLGVSRGLQGQQGAPGRRHLHVPVGMHPRASGPAGRRWVLARP